MKKGFTLIELLAVIIILATLMIIAIPNVLNTLNDSKNEAFIAQAQSIWKTAETQFVKDGMTQGLSITCYDKTNLDMQSVANNVSFVVRLNSIGKVQSIEVVDTVSQVKASGSSEITNISLTKGGSYSAIVCSSSGGGSTGGETGGSVYTAPNAPVLGNLIPIVYNETSSKWEYANTANTWYDYQAGKWANAVVLSSGVSKSVGDTINDSDIALWYVWIPRFEYKLPTDSIGKTGTPKAIDIKFVSSSSTTNTSGFEFHPGFNFNGSNKAGFWFAKFEASKGTSDVVTIKPNADAWTSISVYNIDQKVRVGMLTSYSTGLSGFDSHNSKFFEWSAVTYLTNSIYGKCSDSNTCTEVANSTPVTGSSKTGGGEYRSNITYSTTGNVYGIYDMNGGKDEYVMAYLKNYLVSSNSSANDSGFTTSNLPDSKHYDLFESSSIVENKWSKITKVNNSTSKVGLFNEFITGANSVSTWYSDQSSIVTMTDPWLTMGGSTNQSSSGIFASSGYDGGSTDHISFRPILIK